MVYEKEPKSGYCDTGWSFSSYYNSNNSTSQERYSATPTTEIVNKYQLGRFDSGGLNIFLTLIPILILFLHLLLTDGHEVRSIYYYIGCRIIKVN